MAAGFEADLWHGVGGGGGGGALAPLASRAPLALLAPDHFRVCPSPIALEVLHGKGMPSTSPSHKSASIAARFEADLWLVGYFRVCPSPIALEVLLG